MKAYCAEIEFERALGRTDGRRTARQLMEVA